MNEAPQLLRPVRHVSGQSPTRQRVTDDILAHLAPATAVDALSSATGRLRDCLDVASAAERDFAMRTAVASKSVWEWLDELSEWEWPTDGGSAGFEIPNGTRRKLFGAGVKSPSQDDHERQKQYMGSLHIHNVARYERRVEEIYRALDNLAVEEIKTHVMTNHIMPLSRPTTPITDATRTRISTLARINKMEDLTAVVTAIVVQTLPNLAKLSRLLQIWSTRISVLQGIPSLLRAMSDAEFALRSGWTAISTPAKTNTNDVEASQAPALARKDYLIMKQVIDAKVSKPGRSLDFMLDSLEGLQDTLPDGWLDRMEAIERDYSDWVAACERRVRESSWTQPGDSRRKPHRLSPVKEKDKDSEEPGAMSTVETVSNTQEASSDSRVEDNGAAMDASSQLETLPDAEEQQTNSQSPPGPSTEVEGQVEDQFDPQLEGHQIRDPEATVRIKRTNGVITLPVPQVQAETDEPSKASRDARNASQNSDLNREQFKKNKRLPLAGLFSDPKSAEAEESRRDGSASLDGTQELPPAQVRPPSPPPAHPGTLAGKEPPSSPWQIEDGNPSDAEESPEDEDELELPPLRNSSRRDSDASQTSTVIHGASSQFGILSSDLPEVSASPEITRARVRQAEYVNSSPPSSPPQVADDRERESSVPPLEDTPLEDTLPEPESATRESSLAPTEGTEDTQVAETFDDESMAPKTPLDGSFVDDYDDSFSISELATPGMRRESTGDQQLRQQISHIIDSIPAKIKLAKEPPNLNPPDLQLPRLRKKPSKEPFKRSTSAMSNISTRTSTPSFTLAPAAASRARHNRTQQEIKVYHLSRSTGEAPIKLFIRCVGENGERVMVRVGGGWADLSEYLKEYASHHGRRSAGSEKAKVEVRDVPRVASGRGGEMRSSPPSRPASALEGPPTTPLAVRKTRRSMGAVGSEMPRLHSGTPAPMPRGGNELIPSSEERGDRSRSSSRLSWVEDDSSFLGLSGPSGKKVEMSEENKAWVESVKEKVRLASGERRTPAVTEENKNKFGELGKVGGTKRVFPKKGDFQGEGKK